MLQVKGTHILAVGPAGSSQPDSVTFGYGWTWIEYGNGADSTGKGGSSTIVAYGSQGQVEQTYTINGSVDGLKYNPITGNVWALVNQDGNATLRFIDPRTHQVSAALSYGSPYVYGPNSSRGYDDVVFAGGRVFMSYTNPANPGDPVVQELTNGTAPVGTLYTSTILSFGDTGTNMTTGQTNQPLPVTDPDSLKALPDGSLMLSSGDGHTLIIIKHPGTFQQTVSFIELPAGFGPDDAIMPTATSGVFTIANTSSNTILTARVSGLNTHDIYANISSKNELVQIDPNTGTITPVLTNIGSPHGLGFTPDTPAPVVSKAEIHTFLAALKTDLTSDVVASVDAAKSGPKVEGTHILATAPAGASAPDSVTTSYGLTWIEYGNGASSTGGPGTSTIVAYGSQGQIVQSYSIAGSVDGLKYDPLTGDIWALSNQDANSSLRIIDPRTQQVSLARSYGSGYVYGASSSRGFDDVAFDGNRVFLSYTNPASKGDAVLVQLTNGTAPFGTLEFTRILSLGDAGTNLTTGQTNQTLPLTDPDSLKTLPDGSLILSGGNDDALTIIRNPGTAQQTDAFIQLPAGFSPDDAVMPTASSGVFTISNGSANDVLQARVSGLNTHDIYADLSSKNELVQIDPTTGAITPILTGLSSPHGLSFAADAATPVSVPHDAHKAIVDAIASVRPQLVTDLTAFASAHGGSITTTDIQGYATSVADVLNTLGLDNKVATLLAHHTA